MSYEEKMDRVYSLLTEYWQAIGNEPVEINEKINKFKKRLISLGGINENTLSKCTWEDIEKECAIPRLVARQICEIFREKSINTDNRIVSPRRAQSMTPKELIDHYDPDIPNSPVTKILRDISNDKPFIVFNINGIIDKEVSLKLLNELRQGHPPRDDYILPDGSIVDIYRVGSKPADYVDENPLYRGQPLRPDGTCYQTGRNWMGIDKKVKHLVYLARTTGELIINSLEDAHNIIDIASRDDADKVLTIRFRKAAKKYHQLEADNNLPRLRVKLGRDSTTREQTNNPFGRGNKGVILG